MGLPPRELSPEFAAAYIGVSTTMFDTRFVDGRMLQMNLPAVPE